jgi:L-lactate dehydrogenase
MTNLAGIQIDTYCPLCGKCLDWESERARIEEEVRKSAYHIIDYKGATNFAVSLVMVTITQAILRGQNNVLTVSTMLEGEFGIDDVCLSVPSIVSAGGVHRIIQGPLRHYEREALYQCALALKNVLRDIGL